MPIPCSFFPHKKAKLPMFFTVKHFFFRIKWWPGAAGPVEKRKDGSKT
jgi:hypothetical protein